MQEIWKDIQGSDHYLIPKDIFIELFDEMENWREEAKELAKKRNVKPDFIRYLSTPANKRRIANRKNNNKTSKALVSVKIDDED